ncbi:MAG: mandelate racemase/muconate lactonizing enzyme family protein [Eubacteriales bacterium]
MVITDIQFLVTKFRFEEPMKVAFATITDMDSCIVKILTDEGITGYGEAAPLPFVTGDNLGTVLAVGKELRSALIGMDPRAVGAVHRVMDRLYAGNGAVKAGIDIACYDIAAKAAGVPLYKYLGGDDPHIHSDVTIGIDSPERMAEKALDWTGRGFDILKIKLGEDVRTDLERMCAVHEAVGSKARLRVDANQGWSVKDTLWISRELAALGVELIEQPVPADDFEGMREIRERSSLLIAADESCHGIGDAMRLASMRSADVINIKLMKCGGIYPAIKIAAVCEAAGLSCMIGCMGESTLGNLAGMHLAAALDVIREVDLDAVYILAQEKVRGGFDHRGGKAVLWDVPGIGCTVKGESE